VFGGKTSCMSSSGTYEHSMRPFQAGYRSSKPLCSCSIDLSSDSFRGRRTTACKSISLLSGTKSPYEREPDRYKPTTFSPRIFFAFSVQSARRPLISWYGVNFLIFSVSILFVANFAPHYFCIICKNLTHVCYIKLFLIQGSEVAVDNFSYRDTIHEFILVIHMLVLSLPPCSKQSQKSGRRVASELIH